MPHTLLLIAVYCLACPFNSPSYPANSYSPNFLFDLQHNLQIAPPLPSLLCPASSNLRRSWFLTFLWYLPYNYYFCDYWFTCLYLLLGCETLRGRECVLSFPCGPPLHIVHNTWPAAVWKPAWPGQRMLVKRKEMNLSTWDEANIWNTYEFKSLGRKKRKVSNQLEIFPLSFIWTHCQSQ